MGYCDGLIIPFREVAKLVYSYGKAVNQGYNPYHLLQMSMLDGHLLLQVNLAVAETIHPECDKYVTGVKIKANDSPLLRALKLQIMR